MCHIGHTNLPKKATKKKLLDINLKSGPVCIGDYKKYIMQQENSDNLRDSNFKTYLLL